MKFGRSKGPQPVAKGVYPRPEEEGRVRDLICLLFTLLISLPTASALAQLVKSIDAVGMTVSDMDRSVDFLS